MSLSGCCWLTALTLLLGLWCLPASAATDDSGCHGMPLTVDPGSDRVDLGSCLWFLEDPEDTLTFEAIQQRDADGAFRRHDGGILNLGYTESVYWTRLDLALGEADAPVGRLLELSLPLVDEATLYILRDGELTDTRRMGYDSLWSDRELKVPNPVYQLTLRPEETLRLYLRVETANTFRLPLVLWKPSAYLEQVAVDELIQGLFLGAMLAMMAYNLFVAVSVREPSNVNYVLFLVFGTLFLVTEQVHGLQLFESRPWFLDKQLLHYQILLAWLFGLQMARQLLELPERAPGIDKAVRVGMVGVGVTLLMSPFMPYHTAMEWTVLGSMLLALFMLVVSFWFWRNVDGSARSYFLAWTSIHVGIGVYALTVTGHIPLNSVSAHAPHIGFALQAVLFSFALADRIKLIQAEALDWNRRALANLGRYQSLFNNAVEGIFQMSLERRFITVNPALARMVGYASSKRLRREVPDVLSLFFADPERRAQVVAALERDGGIKGVEAPCQVGNGKERWLSLSINTVYDAEGEPSHLEGTCIDITERKQREQMERERENERLEKDVARNAAEAKSQFLANMSHEIRTPLAAIIGYGESLLDPALDRDAKEASAETVVRSGRHLLDLVNDILDHSKIDANKLSVDIVTVDLPELLDEVRAFFTPRAREKGIEFSVNCDFPLPETIQTDPTRLRQIIINLCGNALKFTEKGAISVSIRCHRPTEELLIRVADTGIGMTPDQLNRLFDPFAQGGAEVTRQYGGTGLGLSISRRLAELLGGRISVSSTYGEGSEFEVHVATGSLEGVHLLRDSSELTQRNRLLPVVSAPQLKGRILCAEDNDVNRRLVGLLIERTGADVTYVENGAEAFEKATREDWDLILMDIQMPVMNGRDAAAAIRKAGVNTPIIALTANVMGEDIEDYRRAGCTDHIAKPIDRRRFYEMLARYLTLEDWPTAAEEQQYQATVLVVEDNEDNRRLVERLLARFGITVMAVTNGREAVQRALSDTVHLVLMDRHLPEMDGPEATRTLRQTGFRRPIIAFTAGDQQEIDALTDAGCEGVLTKPIDTGHLASLLDRYLADYQSNTSARQTESSGLEALVERFRQGLPERLEALEAAWSAQDWVALQRHAHQVKGTAGAMGYPDMTEQAATLERQCRQEEPEAIGAALAALRPMLEAASRDHEFRSSGATFDS
nr:response regulator [Tamilnaduibacter salinus]